MWFVALALAQTSPDDAAEEIIVWAKPFARFDDKRWVVKGEIITPSVIQLGTATHRVRTNAWQIEAVVHCNLDGTKKKLREAHCVLEDVAIRAHTTKSNDRDTGAVVAMAEEMKGKTVQLQVNHKGRVPNLDLEGMPEDNVIEKKVADGGRVLMRQLAAAFHMDAPDGTPNGTDWYTDREPLLEISAPFSGIGSAEVVHRIDVVDGNWILQTVGRSTTTTRIRNATAGIPCFRNDDNPRCPKDQAGNPLTPDEPDLLDEEMRYVTEINGVAVIDPNQGYPTERVWSVNGKPGGRWIGTAYWSGGFLRELGKEEKITLGASGMVGAPQADKPSDQPPWVSVAQP